ncbi:MAG: DUF3365 domain-containing protein [Saprospiraceae bacterium]|nr:DUF3365 domain-containing protein [Saprospiraceae bacterium]
MKKIIIAVSAFATIIILAQCGGQKASNATQELDPKTMEAGLAIISQNCISCHNAETPESSRVAPPLVAIKQHYLGIGADENTFVNNMVAYLLQPDEKNTKMPRAVQRFGLMPKMDFTKEQFEAIAKYLFYTDVEAPDWYAQHVLEEQKKFNLPSDTSLAAYMEAGKTAALTTKAELGKNLLGAINNRGTAGAVEFCNLKATGLTDSMQNVLHTKIKRVSDQYRNPENAANLQELEYIIHAKKQLAETGDIKPKIQEMEGGMVGYYPITTNKMCLQCHGVVGKDISEEVLKRIGTLYPQDKATGYGENELRGIWVVEMERKSK